MELLGLTIKVVFFLATWLLCARMVYQNELDRPENERVGDSHTMIMLSLIWPVWIVGLFLSIAVVLSIELIRLPFKLHKAYRT